MENTHQDPGYLKEREYEEIQNRATRLGQLQNVHTHESNDIESIMNNPRVKSSPEDKDVSQPGEKAGNNRVM